MLISYRRIRCQTPFPHSLSERIQPHAELPTKPLKARPARHLQSRSIRRRIPKQSARPDGWRFLTGVKDVAEWEGIWESSDGHVFFLEAKHLMDVVSFHQLYGSVSVSYISVYRVNCRKFDTSSQRVSIF